jgi:hypothetical protein
MMQEIELHVLSSERLCIASLYGESFTTEVSRAKNGNDELL